jgi:uncharacterized membrane protein YidH (DUF202 family)
MYCLLFTCIHLIDIVVVVVITKLFFNILDPSVYLSTITQVSAVMLSCIGLYLLITSIRRFYRKNPIRDTGDNLLQKKNYIIMAIIAGLAPCAF